MSNENASPEALLENIFREPGTSVSIGTIVQRDFRRITASYKCTAFDAEEPYCTRYKSGMRGECVFAAFESGMKVCCVAGA